MKERIMEIMENVSCSDYIEAIKVRSCALSSNENFKKDIYEKVKPYVTDELNNLHLEEVDLKNINPKEVSRRGNLDTLYFKILKKDYVFNLQDFDDIERLFRLKSLNGKHYFLQSFGNNKFFKYKETEDHIYLKSSEGHLMPVYYFDEEGRYTALVELSFRLTLLLDAETLNFVSYSIELLEPNLVYDMKFYSICSPKLFNDYENDIRSINFNRDFAHNVSIKDEELVINDFSINFDIRYNSYLSKVNEVGLDIDSVPLKSMTGRDYNKNRFIDYTMAYPKVLEFCGEFNDKELTELIKEIELNNYVLKNASFDNRLFEFYLKNKTSVIENPIYIQKYLLVEALSNDYDLKLDPVSIEDLDAFDLDNSFGFHSATNLISLAEMISCLDVDITFNDILNYVRRTIVNQGIANMNSYIEYMFYIISTLSTTKVELDMLFPPSLSTQLSKLKFNSKYRVFKNYDKKHFLLNIDGGEIKYNEMLKDFNKFKLEGYRFELLKTKEDINSKLEELFIRDSYLLQGGDQKLFFVVYRDGAKKPLGVGKLGRSVNRIAGLHQKELDKVMFKLNNIIDGER